LTNEQTPANKQRQNQDSVIKTQYQSGVSCFNYQNAANAQP